MDSHDQDLRRNGVMQLRAQVTSLERQLQAANDRLTKSEENARKLAEFVKNRLGTSAWSHVDVLRIVYLSHSVLKARLLDAATAEEKRDRPASHIIYKRLILRLFREQAAKSIAASLSEMHRPDILTPDMLAELERILTDEL